MSAENENMLLEKLEKDIHSKITRMTPVKGRQLFQEGGVLIVLKWDIKIMLFFCIAL